MFERFTDLARRAVVHAQDEARELGHQQIGTEHLLLGLLQESDGLAGRALNRLGISLEPTRRELNGLVGRGPGAPTGHIPFTSRSKKVLELSLREALQLGHNYIGTEHILLGIVRDDEGVATQVLEQQGAPGARVRDAVLAEVRRAGSDVAAAPTGRTSRTPGAHALIAAAEQLAGTAPMGTHHLLEAMALLDGSLAGNTLSALGVDPQVLAATIDQLGIDGTSDITPEVAAARRMEIHVDDESVRIVLNDDVSRELAAKLVESMGNPIRGEDSAGGALVGMWQSTVNALQQLVSRVEPDDDEDSTSRTAIVRAALRNRLRRRGR
ncbi:MAG: ATP-dependent Clp protease ATP-binding subunit [Ilumatobacteraceae bacterium]|nr:ATP-dependent Clp protease ATP-binding subunit [Ilumatobacteraceae bacterium]